MKSYTSTTLQTNSSTSIGRMVFQQSDDISLLMIWRAGLQNLRPEKSYGAVTAAAEPGFHS